MRKFFFTLFISCVFVFRFALASTFTTTQNLNFGTIIPLSSSGYITLSSSGAVSGGSINQVSSFPFYQSLLSFHGTGLSAIAQIMTMTVLSSTVTLTNGKGGTVTVDTFVLAFPTLSISLLSPNVDNIGFGATAHYTTASSSGAYTGSVNVRANGLLGTYTATVPISLVLRSPLSISEVTPMHFGNIQIGPTAGVVRLYSNIAQTAVVSGTGIVILSTPAPQPGQFLIQGEPNTPVTVYYPDPVVLTGPGGAQVNLANFNSTPFFYPTPSLDSSGKLTLLMGAELSFAAGQRSGTYSGTYTVVVSY